MRLALLLTILFAVLLDAMPIRLRAGCACDHGQTTSCCSTATGCAINSAEESAPKGCCAKNRNRKGDEASAKLVPACGCGQEHRLLVRSRLPLLLNSTIGELIWFQGPGGTYPKALHSAVAQWCTGPETPPPQAAKF